MSEEEKTPELPNLPGELQELLRGAKVQFMFAPGMTAPQTIEAATHEEPDQEEKSSETADRIRHFDLKPREIRDYLDRYVIRQQEAKKVLSVAICDHYNHVRRCLDDPDLIEHDYAKQNVIMMGPTGVGKTYLMRCIARLIGVPFVKADATKFSETGYVGFDVDDIVRDLVKMANGDIDLARYGIIYIDEIDKIASRDTHGAKDVSGRGVQVNLLKLMEDTEVNLLSQTDLLGQMQAMLSMQQGKQQPRTINTRHMLFIVSGAFDKLDDIVRERIEQSAIGFASPREKAGRDTSDYLREARAADFIKFGFEPEFIGRLPVRVACDALSADDLVQILLKSEDSILSQYREDFQGYGIEFTIDAPSLREIATRAHQEKTGARGLMTVLERLFRDFKFELPSTHIRSFDVDLDTVKTPDQALDALRQKDKNLQREVLREEIQAFARRFHATHGIQLQFSDEAIEALVDMSLEQDRTIRVLCEEHFHDFEYALKLISSRTGEKSFVIPLAVVEHPEEELSRWVVEHFPKSE